MTTFLIVMMTLLPAFVAILTCISLAKTVAGLSRDIEYLRTRLDMIQNALPMAGLRITQVDSTGQGGINGTDVPLASG